MARAATAAAHAADRGRFGAFQSRNFTFFWVGLTISHTGAWMQQVGQGWLVYQLTNTPVWLGVTSLAFAIPMITLPILGGAIADRLDRAALVRNLQLVMVAAALLIAGLVYTGVIAAWHFALFSLIQGIFLAFENPARHALLPDLVPREHLMSAISLFQTSYQLGGFLGPTLAGAILGVFGNDRIDLLFAVNALTYLTFAGAMVGVRELPHAGAQAVVASRASIIEGARFVWTHPALRALLLLITTVGVFGRSYLTLLPVFARDILHLDARGLGFLAAAPGTGVIVGTLALAASRVDAFGGRTMITAAALFAATLGSFAVSRWVWLSVPLLLAQGIVVVTLISAMAGAMQLAAPEEMRGRVMSLWTITNIGLPSIGAMLTASAAAIIGAPTAVAAGAAILLIVVGLVGTRLWGLAP